jgi:hypothetical protein
VPPPIHAVVRPAARPHSLLLQRRPVATQAATSAARFTLGDILCQQLIERRGRRYDVRPIPLRALRSEALMRALAGVVAAADDAVYAVRRCAPRMPPLFLA